MLPTADMVSAAGQDGAGNDRDESPRPPIVPDPPMINAEDV